MILFYRVGATHEKAADCCSLVKISSQQLFSHNLYIVSKKIIYAGKWRKKLETS